jgi:hypothetical protein
MYLLNYRCQITEYNYNTIITHIKYQLRNQIITIRNRQIMTLYPQCIYSIILFTVNNKHLFTTNNEIHKYNTRNNNNLHSALTNLTGPHTSGIKVFNHLPQYLKALDHNSLHFRFSLKRFLYHHSIYSVEEYYEYKENTLWNRYIIVFYYAYHLVHISFVIFNL